MRISQRYGTTAVSVPASGYVLDRYLAQGGATAGVHTVQQVATGGPTGIPYFMRCTTTTPDASPASGAYYLFSQMIEQHNINDFAFSTASASSICLSFYIRIHSAAGAKVFGGSIRNGANNRSYPWTVTVPGVDAWYPVSVVIAGDTTGTWTGTDTSSGMSVNFDLGSGSSNQEASGAWVTGNYLAPNIGGHYQMIVTDDDYVDITAVQLVKGTTAPTFLPRSYAEELRLCQRYYQKSYSPGTTPGTAAGTGVYFINGLDTVINTAGYGYVFFPVIMRATPTPSVYGLEGGANKISNASGTDLAASSGTYYAESDHGFLVINASGGDVTTSLKSWRCHWTASSEL